MMLTLIFSTLLLALPPDANLPPNVDPALFPGIAARPPDEIKLAGLSVLYPGRVLHEAPQLPDQDNAGRAPMEKDLPHSVTYLRIYDLKAALQKLTDLLLPHATLILDLRYVQADYDTANEFASTLKKAGLNAKPVQAVGNYSQPKIDETAVASSPPPLVLVLVNRKTAGPLEAWLAAFQDTGSILAVGSVTAGQPGNYAPVQGLPDYRVLAGELQPDGVSIAGTGLQPRFPVEVTPEENYRAYFAFEKAPSDINSLLRQNRNLTPAAPPSATGNNTGGNATTSVSTDDAVDATLQRAVDVVAALQLLGGVPSSTTPAAKETAPASPPAQSLPANSKN